MKESLLEFIVCPLCKSRFSLTEISMNHGEIVSASLVCRKKHTFEVTNGVPRLVIQDRLAEAQKQTQDSYSTQWHRAPEFGYQVGTKEFRINQFLERFGWRNLEHAAEFLSTKEFVLDAGTGLGWHANLCATYTKGEVFGVDISRSIDVAYKHIGHLPNIHLIQADLTRLPFKKGFFEYIISDGVLHHTPSTQKTFKYLVTLLKPLGDIAIYVYKKKSPIREFCDDYIRRFTTELSDEECYKFSEAITKFGKSLSDANVEITVPEDMPYLELKSGRYNLQRFLYWYVFKCFWNDDFDYNTNVIVNFDWCHPKYAWRQTPEEVSAWFREAGLDIVNFNVDESGISILGKKCVD